MSRLGTDVEAPPAILGNTLHLKWSPAREKIPSDPVVGRVRGMVVGQGSHKQKTLSVTRNMVV